MELPEWIATLVGRLTLENEILRQTVNELQKVEDNNSEKVVEE